MHQELLSTEHRIMCSQFAQARSEFLDAFSDLEVAVAKVLRSADAPISSEAFGHILEKFKRVPPAPLLAKANLSRRNSLANEAIELLKVRADVVHSHMKVQVTKGGGRARFVNSRSVGTKAAIPREMTLQELVDVTQKTRSLVADIANLNRINPPSSPLPPSRDAAGGP